MYKTRQIRDLAWINISAATGAIYREWRVYSLYTLKKGTWVYSMHIWWGLSKIAEIAKIDKLITGAFYLIAYRTAAAATP